jgi:hypothetical protein
MRRVLASFEPCWFGGATGRGAEPASEALRLINFCRQFEASTGTISRRTIARWLRGYDYVRDGVKRHSKPLWEPDYKNEDDTIELSFQTEVTSRRKFGQIS